jgi:membrane-associated phospholipid phosphatase
MLPTEAHAVQTQPDQGAWKSTAWLLGGWTCVLAAVTAIGLLLVGPLKGSVGAADNRLGVWLVAHRSTGLTHAANAVSLLGNSITELIVGLGLVLYIWWSTRTVRPVIFVAVVLVGETAIYLITANVVSRPRPPVHILDSGLVRTHSYPSGHVAAATALCGILVVLVWSRVRGRSRAVGALLLALPPLVAVARMYEGAHHLTDVLIGIVYAGVWLSVAATVLLRESASPQRQPG